MLCYGFGLYDIILRVDTPNISFNHIVVLLRQKVWTFLLAWSKEIHFLFYLSCIIDSSSFFTIGIRYVEIMYELKFVDCFIMYGFYPSYS